MTIKIWITCLLLSLSGITLIPRTAVANADCAHWLLPEKMWAAEREDFQIIMPSRETSSQESGEEFERFARQLYAGKNIQDPQILAASNRLLTLAGDYLAKNGAAYELWKPLRGDSYRLHILASDDSVINRRAKKIKERWGVEVFYAPTESFYRQQTAFVDISKRQLFLGHQNVANDLAWATFDLLEPLYHLQAERQFWQGKASLFYGEVSVHGHGLRRLFSALRDEDDYYSVQWAEVTAAWQELAVMAKNLARGRSLDGHSFMPSADEEIAVIQEKLDQLRQRYDFLNLTYKNMAARFLTWDSHKLFSLKRWRQAGAAHNLHALKRWPWENLQPLEDALAKEVLLLTKNDITGQPRLWAIFSLCHEGKRWAKISFPLWTQHCPTQESLVNDSFWHRRAAQQFVAQIKGLSLMEDFYKFISTPGIAAKIYHNYHGARDQLSFIAMQVSLLADPTYLGMLTIGP